MKIFRMASSGKFWIPLFSNFSDFFEFFFEFFIFSGFTLDPLKSLELYSNRLVSGLLIIIYNYFDQPCYVQLRVVALCSLRPGGVNCFGFNFLRFLFLKFIPSDAKFLSLMCKQMSFFELIFNSDKCNNHRQLLLHITVCNNHFTLLLVVHILQDD